MQIVNISGLYNVSPQISLTDVEVLSKKGFEKIICNRPDFEVHPNIQSSLIKKVATEIGLSFEYHPLTFENMNAENIDSKYDNLKTAIITPDKDIIPDAETLNPAFIVFDNYEIILQWNRSLRFALAVCTLKNKFKNEIQ